MNKGDLIRFDWKKYPASSVICDCHSRVVSKDVVGAAWILVTAPAGFHECVMFFTGEHFIPFLHADVLFYIELVSSG